MSAYRGLAIVASLLSLFATAGCGGMRFDGRDDTPTTITLTPSQTKMLTVIEPMIWCTDAAATLCARLPKGTYAMAGEDRTFRFFRAPEPMDFRGKKGPDSQRFILGGIALNKTFSMLPAEIYIDPNGERTSEKVLVLKLGSDFLTQEGVRWTKNY